MEMIPLVNKPMHARYSFHHSSLQQSFITQAWIFKLKLVLCEQTYEMHIQMHHTSSWACSPYLCAQNFSWSLFFFISLPLSLFLSPLFLFPPYLCFSPPLSSMTTKVLNVDRITCRVEIINVNQWSENHFPKFGLV